MKKCVQELLIGWETPEQLPISFGYGQAQVQGIPAAWTPQVTTRKIDCNITETTVVGISHEGLEVRVVCKKYRDFPAVEYVAFLTNRGEADSPVIDSAKRSYFSRNIEKCFGKRCFSRINMRKYSYCYPFSHMHPPFLYNNRL